MGKFDAAIELLRSFSRKSLCLGDEAEVYKHAIRVLEAAQKIDWSPTPPNYTIRVAENDRIDRLFKAIAGETETRSAGLEDLKKNCPELVKGLQFPKRTTVKDQE